MEEKTVVVVAAGAGPDVRQRLHELVDGTQLAGVAAADGGLDRAYSLGLAVDVAVGDFDSATDAAQKRARRSGARIVHHPPDKDATDLELALDEARAWAPSRLLVVGSSGGRLDHLLAMCLALASPALHGIEVDALLGDTLLHVVRRERTLAGARGELVTLLAVGGDALGVTTRGLVYPLADETLRASSCRGVSNVFAAEEATVSVRQGVVLAIRPHPEEESDT